jgi:hypothetical protein
LVEAEQLYEKMLESITNRVVVNLSDSGSPVSTFAQEELCGEEGFHPNFDTTENDSNDATSAVCDSNVSQLQNDETNGDASR